MYAVIVLAALLLSLAPMHAHALLASLPASLPAQPLAEPAAELSLASPAAPTVAPRPAAVPVDVLRTRPVAPVPRPLLCAARPQATALDHAPNAP